MGRQSLNIIVQTLNGDRNGEPIKTGTDGILNFDLSKILFPVMCHLMYLARYKNIHQISEYATEVFSVYIYIHTVQTTSKLTNAYEY